VAGWNHPRNRPEGVATSKGVGIDLLVYHDMTDYTGAELRVGADAGSVFGDTFKGYSIVALGPPTNEGKDVTVVLAHGARPMEGMQSVLDRMRALLDVKAAENRPSKRP
jgi:hypothetical protein